jgi:hypothetical protein
MAHKKVAHVGLSEATGKANSLTLNPPWEYEGSQGPFALDNVEHGHRIVKGATNPNGPEPKAKTSPFSGPVPTMIRQVEGYTPPEPSAKEIAAIVPARLGDHIYIYRLVLVCGNYEKTGWIKSTTPIRDLQKRTFETLDFKPITNKWEVKSYRWTTKDEREARSKLTAGCPWPSELTT